MSCPMFNLISEIFTQINLDGISIPTLSPDPRQHYLVTFDSFGSKQLQLFWYRIQIGCETGLSGDAHPGEAVHANTNIGVFTANRSSQIGVEVFSVLIGVGVQNTTSNECSDQISAESDGLIGSYGIADRDPKRGDINFISIGPLASFAIAISPPFLPRSTTLGPRSNPPMLAFHLKRYWTAND
ncbi:hypothetical protein B0H13DRAFT_2451087 [Mycena leptocephala]|nr:hypothetical protein B0H13DRAFT_2451087 [Mycena leptocephala]